MKQECFRTTKIFFVHFLLISFFIFYSCSSDSPVEPSQQSRGEIVSVTSLGNYNTAFLQLMLYLAASNQPVDITLKYDVDVYKIIYRTLDPKGNLVIASGALFIPKGKDNLPLLSVHHGTQTKRSNVGSVSPTNALEGLIGASLGYYTLVPDYLGLGESNILHPYHHAKSSADCVIDLIRAGREQARKTNIKLNGQVFLAGYSEGGYVTLAAHKEIQQNYGGEITVTASAPMAGAYDLNLTAQRIIQIGIYNQPAYLAFFFVAYDNIYGWNRLNEIFNSPYAERILSLFDGTKTTGEINTQLTNDLSQLFKQNFISTYLDGRETSIITAFNNNSLLNWIPSAPLRFYHGSADEYVPYENSTKARDYFRSVGATNIELVTIPGGTHSSAAIPSIISAIEWFETIRLKEQMFAHTF